MRKSIPFARRATLSALAAACALTCLTAEAAKITITSRDPAGVGFNDTTPAAPVGGNPGTTLGAQRMYVYRYVADIWEQALQSDVEITVNAGWEALTCNATSAVLGSASAWNFWSNFPNGQPNTWYHQALANKLAGVNLSADQPPGTSGYDNVDIKTQFNVNLGKTGCLDGSPFYLGVDGNAGSKVNFATTLLHELGHGLGFSLGMTSSSTGLRVRPNGTYGDDGYPSVWERFMFDNTAGKSWLNMATSDERKASGVNLWNLAWTGPEAVAGAGAMLSIAPLLKTASPAPGGSKGYLYSAAAFGPAAVNPSTLGALATYTTQAGESGPGCDTFNAANIAALRGKVALIPRGVCGFVVKVKNAQVAGAIGVVLTNNVNAAITPGGADPTITIPTVAVTLADGNDLRAAVAAAKVYGSRTQPGQVTASLGTDPTRLAGADAQKRPLLYTPNPFVGGSSVSHWDVTAFPNLLMEPNINADLTNQLVPPKDLTLPLLHDIGW